MKQVGTGGRRVLSPWPDQCAKSHFLTQIQNPRTAVQYPSQLQLGRVDERDSQRSVGVIQAGICYGDQLGTWGRIIHA
jgi:hypothetical protein